MRQSSLTASIVVMAAIGILAGCGGSNSGASAAGAAPPSSAASSGASSATSPARAAAGAAASAPAGDASAFRACLQEHGVTLPARSPGAGAGAGGGDPAAPPADGGVPPGSVPQGSVPQGGFPGGGGRGGPGGPGGSIDPSTQAAFQACAALQPAGGFGGNRTPIDASAVQAYRSCLQDHGVTVNETSTSTTVAGRPGGGLLAGIDRNDPKFAAADATCRPLLPANATGRPGAASTTSTTSA